MPVNASVASLSQRTDILNRLETVMRRDLKLGGDVVIDETMAFSGGGADIDSLDILMLLSSVEKEFNVKITNPDVARRAFQSVGTLVDFILLQVGPPRRHVPLRRLRQASCSAGCRISRHFGLFRGSRLLRRGNPGKACGSSPARKIFSPGIFRAGRWCRGF